MGEEVSGRRVRRSDHDDKRADAPAKTEPRGIFEHHTIPQRGPFPLHLARQAREGRRRQARPSSSVSETRTVRNFANLTWLR